MSQPPALQLIPLASIHPSPYQYRTQFDDAKQQQLIESLRATGLSTPVLVRPLSMPQAESGQTGTESGYELVSGERRWRAAKQLGWESIRAVCEDMSDADAAVRVVTENEVRADTNIMEKAAGYKRLTQPPCNLTLEAIAKRYGFSAASSVKRLIDLLDQPVAIRDFLSQDKIGEAHVRYLSRIKDLDARAKMAKRAAEEGWTVKATEERVAKVLAKAGKGPRKSPTKASPTHQYEYNGFHCALLGDEVVVSGRNFKRTRESLRQFVAEYQSALECFVRDVDSAATEQPAADATSPSAEVAPLHDMPTSEVAADLMKQATEVAAAAQPLKDIFSEIAKAVGPPGSANEFGNASLSDLLTFFNKPRSSG
jgi:ParB family chromosome partitioning protein